MKYRWWTAIDRFWLHTLVGGVIVGFLYVAPPEIGIPLAAIYAYWFTQYELNEDHYLKDEMWRDMSGAMAGLIIAMVIAEGIRRL